MDRHEKDRAHEPTPDRGTVRDDQTDASTEGEEKEANPAHTTTGKFTMPKFGSAGSGGLEYEPGPPRP